MSFGLRNAAQTFQRFIDEVFRDIDFRYAYIDDVLVASTSEEEHEQHLRFSDYVVLLNPAKCVFGETEVTFLGNTVSAEGTWPLEEKVPAINRLQRPVLVKFLIRFHGLINFYRRFIPQVASTHAPPHAALAGAKIKGSHPVDWTPNRVHAFEDCKASISRATLCYAISQYEDKYAAEVEDVITNPPNHRPLRLEKNGAN